MLLAGGGGGASVKVHVHVAQHLSNIFSHLYRIRKCQNSIIRIFRNNQWITLVLYRLC